MAWIYILTNTVNNKKYVGQTINIKQRLNRHKSNTKGFCVSKAIQKYGWDNFKKFYFWCPILFLDFFERLLIKLLNTFSPNGYNLVDGGHVNKHFSEETRKKISQVQKGKEGTFKGKKHTEDSKKKMSEAKIGKYRGNKNYKSRPVICLETCEIFECGQEVERKYRINQSEISACCLGHKYTVRGLHWCFYEKGMELKTEEILLGLSKIKKKYKVKPVQCIETQEIFSSIKEAALKYNTYISSISACCRGKLLMAGGYHWRFYNISTKENVA